MLLICTSVMKLTITFQKYYLNSTLHDQLSSSTHILMLTFSDSGTFLNTRRHTFLHAQLVDELPILAELFHTC